MSLVVIAHRGASGTAPENTLAAFRRAADIGAHMLELDVQLTADGAVVVIHDETLERTTEGTGPVEGLTLAELRRLDAGGWFDERFRGEQIPTLAEVLAAVSLPINVELKAPATAELAERTVRIVMESGALGRVVFSSFHPDLLRAARGYAPTADLAVLWSEPSISDALRLAEGVAATALHIRKEAAQAPVIAAARRAGLAVRVWTVNVREDARRLAADGATGIFTDFPDRFLQNVDATA
ncbi:MAG: glycerophosphodiester phosphodiesterase family protein [Candidatus Binatia bacterium]